MKSAVLVVLAVVVLAVGTVGCVATAVPAPVSGRGGPAGIDLAAMRKVIEENNRRFTQAHVTGEHAVIDGMFTRDAKVLPPGADPVIGRDAIAKLTAQYIEFGVSEFREETTDFYGNGEILIDQGSYVMVYGKEKTLERGKYVNIWKKEDGTWKIYSNIWNPNAPEVPVK